MFATDLVQLLRRLHESFISLAAQLYTVNSRVQVSFYLNTVNIGHSEPIAELQLSASNLESITVVILYCLSDLLAFHCQLQAQHWLSLQFCKVKVPKNYVKESYKTFLDLKGAVPGLEDLLPLETPRSVSMSWPLRTCDLAFK